MEIHNIDALFATMRISVNLLLYPFGRSWPLIDLWILFHQIRIYSAAILDAFNSELNTKKRLENRIWRRKSQRVRLYYDVQYYEQNHFLISNAFWLSVKGIEVSCSPDFFYLILLDLNLNRLIFLLLLFDFISLPKSCSTLIASTYLLNSHFSPRRVLAQQRYAIFGDPQL